MEFASELFERLEDEERPLPKRMRLAQNAYYATGGSSEKIVAWISSRLKIISQEDFNLFCADWRKLVGSVHNQHIRALVKLMLEVVNERLKNDDSQINEDVVLFAVSVLENPRVQNYFFTDLDTYVLFISSLLSTLASKSFKERNVSRKLLETMEVFARMITLREYPTLFVDQLFLPCVNLANKDEKQSIALERQLLSCIEMAVFFRNTPLLSAYVDALLKSKKKKTDQNKQQNPSEVNGLKSQAHFKIGHKLLEKLCVAPKTEDKRDILLAYTSIFKCLVQTNNAALLSCKMLIAICPLIGINVSNAKIKVELSEDLKQSSKPSPDELSFDVLNSVLSVILKENLSFPEEGALQFVNWIECLWRTLLSVPVILRQNNAYLKCLTTLLHLHPRVVMLWNMPIITDVLVALTPEKEIPEFAPFLHTLLSIHQKRFSAHELLLILFTSSKQLLNTRKRLNTGTLSVDTIVPPSVYGDIEKYAGDWTSAPVIDFLDYLSTQLQTLAFTSENQRNTHTDTCAAVAVKLMCGVLSGSRIVEHCGKEAIRLSYVKRLNILSQILKQMGTVAKSSQNVVFINCFLELEYMWAAVVLLLHQYCPEASSAVNNFAKPYIKAEDVKEEEYTEIVSGLNFVHAHISPLDWYLIRSKVAGLQDPDLDRTLVRLEVQTLRYFVISSEGSRQKVANIAKDILPQLLSSLDFENMLNDIYCISKYLQGDELKKLTDKLVEILVSYSDEDGRLFYTKNFSRLQENKSITCGMVLNLLERLENSCSESDDSIWHTSTKLLHKLTSSGVDASRNFISEEWEKVLTSMGKSLHKAFKKQREPEPKTVEVEQTVRQILSVLNLFPLEFVPENLQIAVVYVMFGMSVDLLSAQEPDSLVELIYSQIIFGILERWSITTEAPPLQKYVNMAEMISHVKIATRLQCDVDGRIVHALLGIALKSQISLSQVLEAFFSDVIPADDYAVQEQMLSVLCKDSSKIPPECRENLKSLNSESCVISSLLNFIHQQCPKKHFLHIYTLLLSQSLRRKENLETVLPSVDAYCKISLKILRCGKEKRVKGEEFVREVLKYHEVHKHLPQNFFLDVWSILLESPEPSAEIASLLFSEANKEDFDSMVQRLMKELDHPADSASTKNVLVLWEALIKSPVIAEPNLEKRLNAISFFLAQQHVFLTYPVQPLLKVLLSIVETSKIVVMVYTAEHILQGISTVVGRKHRTDSTNRNIALVQTWFSILNSMLFHRSSQTLDCLPAFTAQLRLLIQNVVNFSRQTENLEASISIAQGVEKMFQTIVKAKLTRNFIRIGAYILADLLKHFEGQLPQEMKAILENIAINILGFLDEYAQRFLGKVLTAESGEMLKEISRIRNLRRTKIV